MAFTIIVGGNRYNVLGPNAAGVPSASDDLSEPYYWRFTTPSLQALTRAVQEADAATRAAIQLEFDNGLADGVVLLTAVGDWYLDSPCWCYVDLKGELSWRRWKVAGGGNSRGC